MDVISAQCLDERAFVMRRVLMPTSSIVVAPQVVRCVWCPVDVSKLYSKAMTYEELNSTKGCNDHAGRKGHLRTSPDRETYTIPSGFATADELRESESHVINRMAMDGRKTAADMMAFCFDKVSGKGRDHEEHVQRLQAHQHVQVRRLALTRADGHGLPPAHGLRQGRDPLSQPGRELRHEEVDGGGRGHRREVPVAGV